MGFSIIAKSNLDLVGFTDNDWEGDNTYQNSTSGYVFMLSEGPITWSSKKWSAIILSSYRSRVYGSCKCSNSMFVVAGDTWRMLVRIRVFNYYLL